jgi:hypothetical protein
MCGSVFLINSFHSSVSKILYVLWAYEIYRRFFPQKYKTLKLDIKCRTVGFVVINKRNDIHITM